MLGLFVERSWEVGGRRSDVVVRHVERSETSFGKTEVGMSEVGFRMLEQTLRHTDPANDREKHPLISELEFRKSEIGFIAVVHCTLSLLYAPAYNTLGMMGSWSMNFGVWNFNLCQR